MYVKGVEKCAFIRKLLTGMNVSVLNIEDHDCPGLSVLRKTWKLSKSNNESCPFNHPPEHCAYYSVKLMLEWWKTEQLMQSRMEIVNIAIRDCFHNGYKNMSSDLVKHLPKDFILNHNEDVDEIFDRLPLKLKNEEEINNCRRCDKHYNCANVVDSDVWDGKNPMRKHCCFCKHVTLRDSTH